MLLSAVSPHIKLKSPEESLSFSFSALLLFIVLELPFIILELPKSSDKESEALAEFIEVFLLDLCICEKTLPEGLKKLKFFKF